MNNEEIKEEVENLEVENNETEVKEKHHKKENKKNNKELEKLQEENRILNDKLLRVAAEMQNMKRRYDDEISKIYRYEGESFIKKTLGILDNFERAIDMNAETLDDEMSKFLNGFKLIYNDLKNNLEAQGVMEIECINKPFDPNEMEAVLTEHVDGIDAGIVTVVMQKGYKYNDKVIRPAMVKVNE